MDAGARICIALALHDRRVSPSFKRGGMLAVNHLAAKIHGEQVRFRDQGETDARRNQKILAVWDSSADVTESFDQFLVRQDPACADDVLFDLRDGWLHDGSIEIP